MEFDSNTKISRTGVIKDNKGWCTGNINNADDVIIVSSDDDYDSPDIFKQCDKNSRDNDNHISMVSNEFDNGNDDNFDTSLLYPEVSIEIEEESIISATDKTVTKVGATKKMKLTPDEEEIRLKTYGEKNPVQFTKIHCTACNVHLGSALSKQCNRFVHPVLKVLICKDCYDFYESGDFEKDEDGTDIYCRWCGQGGNVLCCSQCEMVFCKSCIKRNLGKKKLDKIINNDEWQCFKCDTDQLKTLRVHCFEFMEYVRKELMRVQSFDLSYLTTDRSACCKGLIKRKATEKLNEVGEKRHKNISRYSPDVQETQTLSDCSVSPISPTSQNIEEVKDKILNLIPDSVTSEPKVSKMEKNVKFNESVTFLSKLNQDQPTVSSICKTSSTKSDSVAFKPKVSKMEKNVKFNETVTFLPKLNQDLPTTSSVCSVITTPMVPNQETTKHIPIAPKLSTNITERKKKNQEKIINPVSAITITKNSLTTSNSNPIKSIMINGNKRNDWSDQAVKDVTRVCSNLYHSMNELNRFERNTKRLEEQVKIHNKFQEDVTSSISNLVEIKKSLKENFISHLKLMCSPESSVNPLIIINNTYQHPHIMFPAPVQLQISNEPFINSNIKENLFGEENVTPLLETKTVDGGERKIKTKKVVTFTQEGNDEMSKTFSLVSNERKVDSAAFQDWKIVLKKI